MIFETDELSQLTPAFAANLAIAYIDKDRGVTWKDRCVAWAHRLGTSDPRLVGPTLATRDHECSWKEQREVRRQE